MTIFSAWPYTNTLYSALRDAIRQQDLENNVGVAFVYEWDGAPWFDFQVFRNPEASFSDIDLTTKIGNGFKPGSVMCTVQSTILGRESELLMSNTDSFKTTFPKLPDIRPHGVRIFPKKYC